MRRKEHRVADLRVLIVRAPKSIDDAVRERAAVSGRSLNAEVVSILASSLGINGHESGAWSEQRRLNLRPGDSHVG